jgi:hypothetical protein
MTGFNVRHTKFLQLKVKFQEQQRKAIYIDPQCSPHCIGHASSTPELMAGFLEIGIIVAGAKAIPTLSSRPLEPSREKSRPGSLKIGDNHMQLSQINERKILFIKKSDYRLHLCLFLKD